MAKKFYLGILEAPPSTLTPGEATNRLRDELFPLMDALRAGYGAKDPEDHEAFRSLSRDVEVWMRACVAAIGKGGEDPVALAIADEVKWPAPSTISLARVVSVLSAYADGCAGELPGFGPLARLLVEQLEAAEHGEEQADFRASAAG